MSTNFVGRVTPGINHFHGATMVQNPLTNQFAEMSSSQSDPATPPKQSTHLDVVADYMANHALYASEGITLHDRVMNYFVNDPNALEATDAVLSAVREQSNKLHDQWINGEVDDPYARKVPVKHGL